MRINVDKSGWGERLQIIKYYEQSLKIKWQQDNYYFVSRDVFLGFNILGFGSFKSDEIVSQLKTKQEHGMDDLGSDDDDGCLDLAVDHLYYYFIPVQKFRTNLDLEFVLPRGPEEDRKEEESVPAVLPPTVLLPFLFPPLTLPLRLPK